MNRVLTCKLRTDCFEVPVNVMTSGQLSEGQNSRVYAFQTGTRDARRPSSTWTSRDLSSGYQLVFTMSLFTQTALDSALRELHLMFKGNRASVPHIPRKSIREGLGRENVNHAKIEVSTNADVTGGGAETRVNRQHGIGAFFSV